MASLMENLMDTLEKEGKIYEQLRDLSMQKTQVIVASDTVSLGAITEQEQILVDQVNEIDKNRTDIMKDIANVMNKDVESLTLPFLVSVLSARPNEQKRLSMASDHLKQTVRDMARINEQNRELINNALELVAFDLNIVRGLKAAPETAEYNKGAVSAGNLLSVPSGRFDAKQ